MLEAVKRAMRLTVDAYDEELLDLIAAAKKDLGIAGVTMADVETDPLMRRAIVTYCRMSFGSPDDYDKLKASYDEQKAQMYAATGYTDWGEDDAIC